MILQSDFELRILHRGNMPSDTGRNAEVSSEVGEETKTVPEVSYGPHSSRCFCLQTTHSLSYLFPLLIMSFPFFSDSFSSSFSSYLKVSIFSADQIPDLSRVADL